MPDDKRRVDDADPGSAGAPAQAGEETAPLTIVGIGASAGGLEAVSEVIRNAPPDGMAYLVVQHLAPDHESVLPELLAKRSERLAVCAAEDGMMIEANHVYVIPPKADLAVLHGKIRLVAPDERHAVRLPVDYLFRSLAEDQGSRAIGIVLSGTGSDGTFGLKAIKAAGGLTIAQDPGTAKYDGMPRSAIASGAADFVLAPGEIGEELARIAHTPATTVRPAAPVAGQAPGDPLVKLFVMIRSQFGTDLTQYKQSTIGRRITRRMMLHRLGRLDEYVRFVQTNPAELRRLYADLLITVTSFFRDPDVYEAIQAEVLPHILGHKDGVEPVRIWVPACATGEEAYSLAMILLEYGEQHGRDPRLQIFATDVDEDAIQHARRGVYPANIALDVSPERLNRFFVQKDEGYQINRRVRDTIVFSRQNLLKDAPFSRMDLVSCRNLLIYLQPAAQKKVLRVLHYALNPNGFLVLGASEAVGDAPDLFSTVDRKHKIYGKRQVPPQALEIRFGAPPPAELRPVPAVVRPAMNLQGFVDRKVLELYGPAGVVITEDLEILQFRGNTGPYLGPAPGSASLNLLKVARPELHVELKRAVQEAASGTQRVTRDATYSEDGKRRTVKLDVVPIRDPETKARCLLVTFQPLPPPREIPVLAGHEASTGEAELLAQRIQELERELATTREYLQTTLEERESTLEELKSANEELQSSNEELQSTNEELETSKEEMESTNEELTTVNEELQNRMAELSQTNDDLHNVLAGVENAVIIVGLDLRIRRYTGAAGRLFNLVPADLGRSIGFLDPFFGTALEPKVTGVIQNLATLEEEIVARNQRWYGLRILPYKTLDHMIRGALLTLTDIDVRKRAAEITENVGAYADRFLAAIGQPLLILDSKLRVVWCNEPFLEAFQVMREEVVGSTLPDIAGRQLADPHLRERLDHLFATGVGFRDLPLRVRSTDGVARVLRAGASQVPASGGTPLVLVSMEPDARPAEART